MDENEAMACPECGDTRLQLSKGKCPSTACGCTLYYVYCEACGGMFLAAEGYTHTVLEDA